MSTRTFPSLPVLGAGVVLGITGDALLRPNGPPGLNLLLWAAAVAAAAVLLHRRRGGPLSREAITWLSVGVLFTAGMAWRDSEALKTFALGSAVLCFALPAFRAGAAWVRSAGLTDYAAALGLGGLSGALGAAPVLARLDWQSLRQESGARGRWRHAAAGVRGLIIATPLLVVFGGLFIAADAVFADLVAETVRIDLDTLVSHLVVAGFLGWIAIGYLRGFIAGTRVDAIPSLPSRGGVLGITDVGTALLLLNLLFLAFVVVQFRYLFGGAELIEVTPGLTYAEYARRGFFELVAVVALTLPWLLAADWLLRRDRPRDELVFRILTGAQIVLVLAVLASAVRRLQLYQAAYGLTEQRFYASALLVLLTFVLFWFAGTVLRGRRASFAFGTLVATLATVAVLHVVNPDAWIARTNVERAAAGATPFDAVYATSLSGDAVPVTLAALPGMPEATRCRIAQRLLSRWSESAPPPLRSWTWSSARARRAVGGKKGALQATGDFL
jgi:hypothetical protein